MKRLIAVAFVILLIMFSIMSCEKGEEPKEIEYEEGIYHDKNLDDNLGSYNGTVIADKNVAVDVATSIFNSLFKDKVDEGYAPQLVFYDKEEDLYVVSFWNGSCYDDGTVSLGEECSIAIRASDGKVLKIWFAE
ncbi:MAG: hypothetical protein IJ309_05075 [Clostridia bacterium]|nr:hypothetical protein [Clostridia bacterium]MBQ7907330.1 hypothetical protein [Clostridia bacterium]